MKVILSLYDEIHFIGDTNESFDLCSDEIEVERVMEDNHVLMRWGFRLVIVDDTALLYLKGYASSHDVLLTYGRVVGDNTIELFVDRLRDLKDVIEALSMTGLLVSVDVD